MQQATSIYQNKLMRYLPFHLSSSEYLRKKLNLLFRFYDHPNEESNDHINIFHTLILKEYLLISFLNFFPTL